MPPTGYEPHPSKESTWGYKTMYRDDELKGLNRTHLLFFAGQVTPGGGRVRRRGLPQHHALAVSVVNTRPAPHRRRCWALSPC